MIYALYDGERNILDGTRKEIAQYTGLKPDTIRWYGTPSGQKKGNMALIKIEEDDDMYTGSTQTRSKRTHSIYAPTPTNDEMDVQEKPVTIIRGVKPAEWKPERYTRQLYDHMFKKWQKLSDRVPSKEGMMQ